MADVESTEQQPATAELYKTTSGVVQQATGKTPVGQLVKPVHDIATTATSNVESTVEEHTGLKLEPSLLGPAQAHVAAALPPVAAADILARTAKAKWLKRREQKNNTQSVSGGNGTISSGNDAVSNRRYLVRCIILALLIFTMVMFLVALLRFQTPPNSRPIRVHIPLNSNAVNHAGL